MNKASVKWILASIVTILVVVALLLLASRWHRHLLVAGDTQWQAINDAEYVQVISHVDGVEFVVLKPGRSAYSLASGPILIKDVSSYRFLTFEFRGTGSGLPFKVELMNPETAVSQAQFTDDKDGWSSYYAPFPVGGNRQGTTLKEAVSVRIALMSKSATGTWRFRNLEVGK